MGAIIKLHKDGIEFDPNGEQAVIDAFEVEYALIFKSSINMIERRFISSMGLEMIELSDFRKPNRRIHYSFVEKVVDKNGVEYTGVDIDSNQKILDILKTLMD